MKQLIFCFACLLSLLTAACSSDDKLQENVDFRGLSLKRTLKALEGNWTEPYTTLPTQIVSFDEEHLSWQKFKSEDIYGYTHPESGTTDIWLPISIENGILTIAKNDWAEPLPLHSEGMVFIQYVRTR